MHLLNLPVRHVDICPSFILVLISHPLQQSRSNAGIPTLRMLYRKKRLLKHQEQVL